MLTICQLNGDLLGIKLNLQMIAFGEDFKEKFAILQFGNSDFVGLMMLSILVCILFPVRYMTPEISTSVIRMMSPDRRSRRCSRLSIKHVINR